MEKIFFFLNLEHLRKTLRANSGETQTIMYKLNYQTYQDVYRYQFPVKISSFFVLQIVLTPLELLFNMFMTALKSFYLL